MEVRERLFPSLGEVDHVREISDLEAEVTALFDQWRGPLLRYVYSFGLSQPDAEEVVQETFLSLFLHLRAGKSRSNLRGWIFRVAHNLGLKRREKNQRGIKLMPEPASEVDGTLTPEEALSLQQQQQRLMAMVRTLPEHHQRCLYLRAEGFRYREIAKILGISVGGVALLMSRLLSRLSGSVDAR